MTNSLEDALQHITVNMENEEQQSQEQETQPEQTIHIHYFPDAIVILKEDEQSTQVVDSTPVPPQNVSFLPAYTIGFLYLLLIVSTIAFQLYLLLNPPIATVTLIPQSQTVTLHATLRIGRLLNTITISQSQTTPTTGKGHQDARSATGYITIYNGQLNSITLPSGTILTASNGIQIITDQEALIPQATPPLEGHATIIAHIATTGIQGNIQAHAINEACCAISVLAVNLTPFSGGQDERNFQIVTKRDIDTTAMQLKTSLAHSISGALQGQLKPNEQLFQLPCTPTVTADHQIGAEATHVLVTVSQTCSAVAYNSKELTQSAMRLLSTTASQRLEAGYSVPTDVQTTITSITPRTSVVMLSVTIQGMFVYQITTQQAQALKSLIAGKTKQNALAILNSQSGIESASIAWGDDTKLPKDPAYIHFQTVVHT